MKVCSHDYNIRCKRTAPQWKQNKTQTVIVSKQSELQFIDNTAVTALCDMSCPYQLGSSLCAQLSRAREHGTDLDDSDLFLLAVAVEKSLPARSKSALRPRLGLTRKAQTSGPRLLCAFFFQLQGLATVSLPKVFHRSLHGKWGSVMFVRGENWSPLGKQ